MSAVVFKNKQILRFKYKKMPQFFHITKTGSSILITYIIFYQFVNCNLDGYYALRKCTVLDFEIEKVQGLTLFTTSQIFSYIFGNF